MKKYLLSLAFGLSMFALSAQDVHFTQFYASPLTLNPSLVGKVECTWRAAANYRNQWNSIPAPYQTYSASYDHAFLRGKMGRRTPDERVGVGLLLVNDVAGDGNLYKLNIGFLGAYHKQLGEGSLLSAGFQIAAVQRGVDASNLIFPIQIPSTGPDPTLPSGEVITNTNYIDISGGIHWSTVTETFSFNVGAAYYHITEPTETLINDPTNKLPSRYVGHGGFTVRLTDYVTLSPSFLYMSQAAAQEVSLGSSLGYHMENSALYFGLWYRNKDAINALIGIGVSNLLFGFSYDVSISEISGANASRGGFELSLSYQGCIYSRKKPGICPTF